MATSTAKQAPGYLYGLEKGNEDAVRGHATRKASDHCQYMLPAFTRLVAEKSTLRLLDVGCGPGSITTSLAQLMPEGQVVGLDISDSVLAKARQHAADNGVSNVEFVKGDVYALPFEDGAFDVVHTHQAVGHFHDHVRAIRELLRVTRKNGGMLCMREVDLNTLRIHPKSLLQTEWLDLVIKVQIANGGVEDAGLHLKAWTAQAGVPRERIEMTAGTWCYNTPEQRREYGESWPGRLRRGAMYEKALEAGLATKDQLEELALAWERWIEDDDALFYIVNGQVIARP